MAVLKSVLTGVVLAGIVAGVVACGVALGMVVAAGAGVSRKAATVGGTLLVGFAAAVALAALRIRGARRAARLSA